MKNIKKTGKSDVVISFGNNSYVSKVFLEEIVFHEYEENNFIFIYFNAYIHSTEDYIFKKLCQKLGIKGERNGFAGMQTALEDYFKHYNEKFVIIVFENVEHLFAKKKQVLFYTFLEMLNVHNNILFCGTTYNFNLMDMMEKRIRSRFSQKTMFISIDDNQYFYKAMYNILLDFNRLYKITEKNFDFTELHEALISPECERFLVVINRYMDMGVGIKEIVTKFRYILTLIVLGLNKNMPLKQTIKEVLIEYENEENSDSYINLLKSIFYLFRFSQVTYYYANMSLSMCVKA